MSDKQKDKIARKIFENLYPSLSFNVNYNIFDEFATNRCRELAQIALDAMSEADKVNERALGLACGQINEVYACPFIEHQWAGWDLCKSYPDCDCDTAVAWKEYYQARARREIKEADHG